MRRTNGTHIYINGGFRNWYSASTPFHANTAWKAVMSVRGSFTVATRSSDYRVAETSAILIPPFLMHRFSADGSVQIMVVVSSLPLPILKLSAIRSTKPKLLHPRARDINLLEYLHAYCMDLSLHANTATKQLLRKSVESWMSILLCTPEQRRTMACSAALQRAHRQIAESFYQPLRIRNLARQVGISETHFRKSYRLAFGLCPKEEIIQLRIRKAQNLLVETNLKLAEVAFQCGYSDEQEFSRHFRKRLGVPPGLWRRQ